MRGFRVPLLAAGTLLVLSLPAWAFAQGASPSAPSASTVDTETYDLSFTLPTAAKSGCMVCHGDPNLVRIENGVAVSMWVDSAVIEESAHATIQCTGCHLDFAYTVPHDTAAQGDWRAVAKLACKNCHRDAFTAYSRGVHTLSPAPGETTTTPLPAETPEQELPLCGDCHGGHDIQTLKDNPEAQQALHEQGFQVCGRCHEDYWANYDDYYHGAAYKRGAPDAPACWECHLAHDILPSSDRRSSVHEVNLVETCGQCHVHAPNDAYLSYSSFIHNKEEVREKNPVYSFFQAAIETIRSWFD